MGKRTAISRACLTPGPDLEIDGEEPCRYKLSELGPLQATVCAITPSPEARMFP